MRVFCILGAVMLALFAGAAHADQLELGADAPRWAKWGADSLLWLHIIGGTIGLVAGATAALVSRKGGRLHRSAGKVFVAAMFVTYLIGAGVAPFLEEGQRPNTIAGVMALYLLISGWFAGRTPTLRAGWFEFAGLAIAIGVAGAGVAFAQLGSADPSGTVDGAPPQSFFLFIAAGAAAALGELHVIMRRELAGVARVARHLWRMCISWFIAAGSFFLGQQPIMPEWIQGSPVLLACALTPLAAMAFWLVWVRVARRFRVQPAPAAIAAD